MESYCRSDFMILCDDSGSINETYCRDFKMRANIPGNFFELFEKRSLEVVFELFSQMRKKGYALGIDVEVQIAGRKRQANVSGHMQGELFYIIILIEKDELMSVLNEVVRINNSYINNLRINAKENVARQNYLEEIAYTEISKLNNELVNSHRIIEKQNVELKEYMSMLEEMSFLDSLTGAYNRHFFKELMNVKLADIAESATSVIFVYIDLDSFKVVNDQMGHMEGDRMLVEFTNLCKKFINSEHEYIIRIGGDEFILCLKNQNKEKVQIMMEKIDFTYRELSKVSGVSYGIIQIGQEEIQNGIDVDHLLKSADEQMYLYKKSRKKNTSII